MKKPSLFLRGIIIEEDPFPSVKIFHALQIMKATKCSISVIVKPNNKLCKQWYSLKSSIDENMKKIMKDAFAKTDICFCGIKDLPSDDIYGDWYGYPWLCQDDRKP